MDRDRIRKQASRHRVGAGRAAVDGTRGLRLPKSPPKQFQRPRHVTAGPHLSQCDLIFFTTSPSSEPNILYTRLQSLSATRSSYHRLENTGRSTCPPCYLQGLLKLLPVAGIYNSRCAGVRLIGTWALARRLLIKGSTRRARSARATATLPIAVRTERTMW